MLRAWIGRSRPPVPPRDRHRDGARRDPLGRRGGARARRRALLGSAPGWEGVFTHFHSADSDAGSVDQRSGAASSRCSPRFRAGRRWCTPPTARRRSAGRATPPTSSGRASSSTAAGRGVGAAPRPVAALRARVVAVRSVAAGRDRELRRDLAGARGPLRSRPSASATPTGCPRAATADGGRRAVELRGRAGAVVGRVTMDMTMVAVDDGRSRWATSRPSSAGSSRSTSRRRRAGTISYELLTAARAAGCRDAYR